MREPAKYEAPLCAEVDPELFFPEKGDNLNKIVRTLCSMCDHKIECAEWGIKHESFGIWGGLTPRERQQIRKEKNILLDTISTEVFFAKTFSRLADGWHQSNTST
jgi:WhiB family redox-sensing transcriptional regulator